MTSVFRWLGLLLLVASVTGAVEPVTIRHGHLADFVDGDGSGVSLGSDGKLSRAAALVPWADVGAERIWALAVGAKGQLYVASGDDGRLFVVDDGANRELARIDAGALLSIVIGAHGVYTGSGPGGLLLRTSADGATDTLLSTPSRYVWDLALEGNRVVMACGAEARVLRWHPDGKVDTLFHQPGDGHVRSLTRRGERWLAATAAGPTGDDDNDNKTHGRVYELDGDGGARLLVETKYEEVVDLVTIGNTVFAAAMTVPASGQATAALLRIGDNGAVYAVWEGSGIWAGLTTTGHGLLAVTREPMRVLQLSEDGDNVQILARSDSLAASTITRLGDDLILGDSQSGRLMRLARALPDSGFFDAPVQDLGIVSTWGTLTWRATGKDLFLRTRSGNSAAADDSWSAWSGRLRNPGDAIVSPPARYLQYRVVFAGDAEANLEGVSFTARQINLPPRIDQVITFPYRGGAGALQNPEQIAVPSQNHDSSHSNGNGIPQRKSLRVLRWQTSDPNHDPLSMSIYLQGEDQRRWKLVEEDVQGRKTILWDTELMPEGPTRLKLVASDAPANPGDSALQDSYVTKPFVIDNTPPILTLRQRQRGADLIIEADVEDAISVLRGARYSIDYDDHTTRLGATDGLFDARHEQLRILLAELSAGEHVVSVHAWDEMDNIGVAQIVVEVAP